MKSPLQHQLPRIAAGALIVVALATGTAQAAPPALGRIQPTATADLADSGSAGSGSASGPGTLSFLVLCALGIKDFQECKITG